MVSPFPPFLWPVASAYAYIPSRTGSSGRKLRHRELKHDAELAFPEPVYSSTKRSSSTVLSDSRRLDRLGL